MTVVRFATWQEGLLLKEGNPKHVRGLEDLARPDVRMVNREKGRALACFWIILLSRHHIPSQIVRGLWNDCFFPDRPWAMYFGREGGRRHWSTGRRPTVRF